MTGDSLTPEQPPSGPLYAPESASDPSVGTQRGSGVASGPQTGTDGFGRLPEIIPGRCLWKEAGPDGHRACILPEHHDGDCDMQPAPTGGSDA